MKLWFVIYYFLALCTSVFAYMQPVPTTNAPTLASTSTHHLAQFKTLQTSSRRIDSLKALLESNLHDTSRVNTLIDIAREVWATNPKASRTFASEAHGIAERIGFTRGIANAINAVGVAYFYQGWYDIALEHYQESLKIRQEIKDLRGVGSSLNNIGLIYSAQEKYDDALKYSFQALKVYKEINAKNSTAAALNNIGVVYRKKKMYDSAEVMHKAALEMLSNSNNLNGIALTLSSFGTLEQERGDNAHALNYQRRATALYLVQNNHKGLVDTYLGTAKALFGLARNDEALRVLDSAIMYAVNLNARKELRDCYELLARIEERIGNFAGAYYNVRRYEALKDSLFTEETDTKAAQFNAKYDAELRSKQIALLTSEKERQALLRNVLIGAVIGVIIGALLLYNRFRLKQRSEAALQAANNELSAKNILIEQSKSLAEKLLLNVLPQLIAERMQSGEQRIAERFQNVTVLFADIVDFTTLAATIPAEELVTLLDAVFSDFDALAERYGLEKIKTIGDAYMAVCGIPLPQSDHAERVVRFAADIRRIVQQYRIDTPSGETIPLNIRIGIHSGEVVAGVIGKKKFSYDLWGDTVNIASRLQTHAQAGEIQCSRATYNNIEDICTTNEHRTLTFKGNVSVDAFIVTGIVSKN